MHVAWLMDVFGILVLVLVAEIVLHGMRLLGMVVVVLGVDTIGVALGAATHQAVVLCGVDLVVVNVHLAVHWDGLEMGSVIVRATWRYVALMVVTAVDQGVARALLVIHVCKSVLAIRKSFASVRIRQAAAFNVGRVIMACL